MIEKKLRKTTQQLLLMFSMLKKYIYIFPAYVSKHNWNCEKQVILFMILNGEGREAKSIGRRRQ